MLRSTARVGGIGRSVITPAPPPAGRLSHGAGPQGLIQITRCGERLGAVWRGIGRRACFPEAEWRGESADSGGGDSLAVSGEFAV